MLAVSGPIHDIHLTVAGCGQSIALRGNRKGKFRKTNPSLETMVTSYHAIHQALRQAPPYWWKSSSNNTSSSSSSTLLLEPTTRTTLQEEPTSNHSNEETKPPPTTTRTATQKDTRPTNQTRTVPGTNPTNSNHHSASSTAPTHNTEFGSPPQHKQPPL